MSDAETEKTMQNLYKKTGYILEPHAAIAYQTLENNLKDGETGIFLGTAHPAKFKADVDRILGIDLPLPKAFEISSVFKFKLGFNLFIRVLLPAPV